ncbi:MAG TPA: Ig-like domain-containing protein [Gemmatimonadota bacterium]
MTPSRIPEPRPRRLLAAGRSFLALAVVALAGAACSSDSGGGPSGPITANARPEFLSISPASSDVQLETGDLIAFDVAAADPDGSPVTVEFLVDGVRTDLATHYDFQAAAEGTHQVTVRISDGVHTVSHDWTVRVTPDVQVAPTVAVEVTPDSGLAPLEVAIQVTGEDDDGAIVRWELDADGDGRYEVVEDEPPALTTRIDGAGTLRVRARVTDDEGLIGLAERVVHVTENLPPRAVLALSPEEGLAPLDVHVRGVGEDPEGAIALHELDLDGDGVFDLAQPAPIDTVLVYADYSRAVPVTLRVTDVAGHSAEAVREVRVRPDVDPVGSRLWQSESGRLLADGRTARELTVEVRDRAGRALKDVEVELTSSRNAGSAVDRIEPSRGRTDDAGRLRAAFTTTSSSSLLGDALVRAHAAGTTIDEGVTIQFASAVDAILTSISCPARAVHVAGSAEEPRGATLTATVRDAAGQALPDVHVEFKTRDTAVWRVDPPFGRSDAAGAFRASIASDVPGNTFVDVYADGLRTSAVCVLVFLP